MILKHTLSLMAAGFVTWGSLTVAQAQSDSQGSFARIVLDSTQRQPLVAPSTESSRLAHFDNSVMPAAYYSPPAGNHSIQVDPVRNQRDAETNPFDPDAAKQSAGAEQGQPQPANQLDQRIIGAERIQGSQGNANPMIPPQQTLIQPRGTHMPDIIDLGDPSHPVPQPQQQLVCPPPTTQGVPYNPFPSQPLPMNAPQQFPPDFYHDTPESAGPAAAQPMMDVPEQPSTVWEEMPFEMGASENYLSESYSEEAGEFREHSSLSELYRNCRPLFYLDLFGGTDRPDDSRGLSVEGRRGLRQIDFETGYTLGTRLGLYQGRNLRTDFEFNFRTADFEKRTQVSDNLLVLESGNVTGYSGMSNAYWDFVRTPFRRLTPYIGAGVGFLYIDSEINDPTVASGTLIDTDSSLAIQAMAGASYRLTSQLEFFGEYRFYDADAMVFSDPPSLDAATSNTSTATLYDISGDSVIFGLRMKF